MFSVFKKKTKNAPEVTVDVHSHLIPGVDDGVENFEDSLALLEKFEIAGYRKVITTPHIMQDFYDNSEENLKSIHLDLKKKAIDRGLKIEIELAAEYYLDDKLNSRISDSNESFLTFGDNYLLFETSFMNQPFYLTEFIFKAKSRGFKPVLAHPERYLYLQSNPAMIKDLIERGVLLQLNANSLTGYYSKQVKQIAQKLIDQNLISFVGSDCHHEIHFENLIKSRNSKYYKKLLNTPLLNRSL